MGIFDALTSAVTGLQAQSFALQNISGNIANSQTTAYKGTDTSFQDLVTNAAAGQQAAGGVIAGSRATNTVQGGITSETVATDMAVNGNGYFVVSQPSSFSDNAPVFSGVNDYSRRGDFQQNSAGYLVNGAGYYLMGIPVDGATGNPIGSVPQVLQFNNNFVPATVTTQIHYQANLANFPQTPSATTSIAGSELLNPAGFVVNPLVGPATIKGTGGLLSPDQSATGTGTVGSLTSATPLTGPGSLGLTAGDKITVSDGAATSVYTITGGDTINSLVGALSNKVGGANVTVSLNGGQLVIKSNDTTSTVTISDNAATAGADISLLGYGTGNTSFTPTNLVTQGAVTSGQTLTLKDGTNATLTITFGTGLGQVQTLAQLNAAMAPLVGATATVDQTNGDITVTSANMSDALAVGGSATLSKFGIASTAALPTTSAYVSGTDASTFLNQSIAGGSITTYDSKGNPEDVQIRWAKVTSVAGSGTDSWQMFYQANSGATGAQAAWQNVGTRFTFDGNGQMSPAVPNITLSNLTINGDTIGNVQVVFGANGLTQFADSTGTANVSTLSQNGFAAGKLTTVAVDSQNRIIGTFSNGQTIPLAQIPLATFNGQNFLQSLNGGAYAATADSGSANYSSTGQIDGSSLEGSNVDIATEFSNLVVAQQAYSANAKVMTTADQMIQSLLAVIQ